MRTSRLLALVAAAAALTLTAAGCSSDSKDDTPGDGSSPTASAQSDAKLVLVASIAKFEQESFTFTLKAVDPDDGTTTGSGSSHPQTKSRSMKVGIDGGSIELLVFDTKRYVKLAGLPIPGIPADKWMLLDATKLGPGANEQLKQFDGPGTFAKVLNTIKEAKSEGNGRYTGTLDLSQALDSAIVTTDDLTKLAERAKSVPFEATLDSQGRLTKLVLTVEAGKNTFEVNVADWGTAPVLTEPAAADVVEAPAFAYDIFGG